MRRVRRCVRTGGHPRLAVGTTLTPPWVRLVPSSPHAAAAAPAQGWGTGTPLGWAPPAYCSPSCSAEQAGESTCPSLVALAEAEAAPDTGAAFALLDPREFGNFYKDLEMSWWQHLALGLSEAQRDSPACINTGGSNDISLTSCHGCRSRNASSIHRRGLQINQTKSVPVMTLFTCATLGRWLALSSSVA